MSRNYIRYLFSLSILFSASEFFAQDQSLAAKLANRDAFNVKITPARKINTKENEYAPVYFNDGILFVSSRKRPDALRDKRHNEPTHDIYFAPFEKDRMPNNARMISEVINSVRHEGPVSITFAGDVMYFSRSDSTEAGAESNGTSKVQSLYEASKGGTDWVNVRQLPFSSELYTTMHPAISPDNQRLYFASDMPGGYGGLDIYYVERAGEGWSAPINLGPEINTPVNDAYPFVHGNGDLYFATNGHKGMGGMDLFFTRQGAEQKWSKPLNVGAPVNSKADDLGICIEAYGAEGFFSSNRSGSNGKDDIYHFSITLKDDLPYLNAQVVFLNSENMRRLDEAELRIYELSADGSLGASSPFYSYIDPVSNNLAFQQKNKVQLESTDLISDRNGVVTAPLYKHKKYLLVSDRKGFERVFSVVDGTVKEVRVLFSKASDQQCAKLRFRIQNEKTSEFLMRAKIEITNTSTGHINVLERNNDIYYDICLEGGFSYKFIIQHSGYEQLVDILSVPEIFGNEYEEKTYSLLPNKKIFSSETLQEGASINLNNIYYDYNRSNIRLDATRELEELAAVMKTYKTIEIELIAHTDSRGDWLYNQRLSLQRALSAKEFLVRQGIASSRITALGYGESQIRNHCFDDVECSEDEHQHNRRTEVRIIRMKENVKVEYNEGASNSPIKEKQD
jgi:outer membrane protein OmpA-like peptidoglycan-associated protein